MHKPKSDAKSLQEPFKEIFPQRSRLKLVLGSPGSVLEGSGALLGATWPAFGSSWAPLGSSWAPPVHLLDGLWALVGTSKRSLGSHGRFHDRFAKVYRRSGLGLDASWAVLPGPGLLGASGRLSAGLGRLVWAYWLSCPLANRAQTTLGCRVGLSA